MADSKQLEKAVDDFIEAWEKFLLDKLNTEQVTDFIIIMLKAREASQSDSTDIFE